jgi:hypothetical protein
MAAETRPTDHLRSPAAQKFIRELSEGCTHAENDFPGGAGLSFGYAKWECFICREAVLCRAIDYGIAIGRAEPRENE